VQMDKITEAIAHFIGLFQVTVEQARSKLAYDEFKALQALDDATPELASHPVRMVASYDFEGFEPSIRYVAPTPELIDVAGPIKIDYAPPDVPIPGNAPTVPDVAFPGFVVPAVPLGSGGRIDMPDLHAPGSIALGFNQEIRLSDEDSVSVGDHGLTFVPVTGQAAQLARLVDDATDLLPLDDLEMPGSAEAIAAFITSAAGRLSAFAAEDHGEAGVFALEADAIEGTFVNGVLVGEAPDLDDYLPAEAAAEVETASASYSPGEGIFTIEPSVELVTGGNLVVNSAMITNGWTSSSVIAVMGDAVELNAVVQANVWSDTDLVTASADNWTVEADDPTEAFNIAKFDHVEASVTATVATSQDFPENWLITVVEGDLINLNWVDQTAFITDSDAVIASSSGVTTFVSTGENQATDVMSLAEIGYGYDLIVIAGNLYDASLIQQVNVMLDDDLIGAVEGFETTGNGSANSHGNLLWNEAEIIDVGGQGNGQAMPQHYRDAAETLGQGKKGLPDEVLKDSAFAGGETLKVLYISGDMLDLHAIKQTSVLGDADQVALAMDQMQAHADADWSVSTGDNSLVNYAGILDVDGGETTYVGGEQYSDEILIQAELISDDPALGGQDPDVLVNEAVAFLGNDDMPGHGNRGNSEDHGNGGQPNHGHGGQSTNNGNGYGHANHGHAAADGQPADIMQSMLA